MITAAWLAALGGGCVATGELPSARGVAFHSAQVRPGDAFFALPGASRHGLDYAAEALAKGAAFIVSDRPQPRGVTVPDPAGLLLKAGAFARSQLAVPVIAVTGSAGKTSTKAMISAALEAAATPGNFNTPLALAQTLIAAWLKPPRHLVLELGIDRVGDMDSLIALTKPTHSVLTLIASSHLSGLGDIRQVATEKCKLPAAARGWVSAAALPYLLPGLQAGSIVYGLDGDSGCDVTGRVLRSEAARQQLEVLGVRFWLPYPSPVMARNAVAAMALAQAFGIDLAQAAARLSAVRLEPGRLQIHTLPDFTLIDDSYNSNPASLAAALHTLTTFPGPHTAILGDMLELGLESEVLHRAMGRATHGLEQVLFVGPESRIAAAENPQAHYTATVEALLASLEQTPLAGAVLVKGSRGMRLERVVQALLSRATPPEVLA